MSLLDCCPACLVAVLGDLVAVIVKLVAVTPCLVALLVYLVAFLLHLVAKRNLLEINKLSSSG